MCDRMRVAATWRDGNTIYAMRDDGRVFSSTPGYATLWEPAVSWGSSPVPGCEVAETRPGTVPLNVTEQEMSLMADAVHRYRSSASGALRDQLDRLWRTLVS